VDSVLMSGKRETGMDVNQVPQGGFVSSQEIT
jgi:hypothetical protein